MFTQPTIAASAALVLLFTTGCSSDFNPFNQCETSETRCENNTAFVCASPRLDRELMLTTTDCTPGGNTCVVGNDGPECVYESHRCAATNGAKHCDGTILIECRSDNVGVGTDCGSGNVCREGGGTADCVPDTAVSCASPGTKRCEGAMLAECVAQGNAAEGYEVVSACEISGETCAELNGSFGCAPPNPVACDTATFVSSCDDKTAITCKDLDADDTSTSGFEVREDCVAAGFNACVEDTSFSFCEMN